MISRRFSAVLVAVTLQACSARPEQTIIGDFFAASRLRDLTALSRFATVVFEPHERGIVTTFIIRHVSAERVEGSDRLKDVTIVAPVRRPDGSSVDAVFVVRLQRYGRTGEPNAPALYGGWIITGLTEAPPVPGPLPSQ